MTDQVALVTGAGRGIGRAIALKLARSGVRLVLAARSHDELDDVASSITQEGGTVLSVPTDVTDEEAVHHLIETSHQAMGPIDILINNAGIALFDEISISKSDDWMRMFDVNVLGALRLTQSVLPSMLERDTGRIVMLASTASHKAYRGQAGYCASKHALLGFARVLMEEIRGSRVRVHIVSPGGVDTSLARNTRDAKVADAYMHPDEVADAVHFVLSREGIATVDEVIIRRHMAAPTL